MPIVRHNSEAIHCEDDAIVADVLSPFDVHRFLPRKLRPRYFHSATGNFCRGSSGCLEQFGKGMSRCLEVSYNGFRHLWLGSACRSEIAREKLKDAVFFLVHRLAVDQDHFHAEREERSLPCRPADTPLKNRHQPPIITRHRIDIRRYPCRVFHQPPVH